MMGLPTLSNARLKGKRVLLRLDTDVPIGGGNVVDDFRLTVALPTIDHLLSQRAKVIILGHKGNPKSLSQSLRKSLSLKPIASYLAKLLKEKISLLKIEQVEKLEQIDNEKIVMLENLRFDNGEEENDPEFAKRLAELGDFYINESFADCHREHASVVALPYEFKSKSKNSVAAGLHLIEEIKNLSRILENPVRPVVIIIGGAKTEKAKYIDKLLDIADWVLVGGLLPRVVESYCRMKDGKVCVAAGHLIPSGGDIDEASTTNFVAIASNAGTIVWNGPMGEYEKKEFGRGTEIVAQAIAQNKNALKIVGGGDTVQVLQSLGILDKMNWVSTGGGAMLQFLAYGTLPGIEALRV